MPLRSISGVIRKVLSLSDLGIILQGSSGLAGGAVRNSGACRPLVLGFSLISGEEKVTGELHGVLLASHYSAEGSCPAPKSYSQGAQMANFFSSFRTLDLLFRDSRRFPRPPSLPRRTSSPCHSARYGPSVRE